MTRKLSRALLVALTTLFMLLAGLAAPASSTEGEEPSPLLRVSGMVTPTAYLDPLVVSLCAQECFTPGSTVLDSPYGAQVNPDTGLFVFEGVPAGTYALVVAYHTPTSTGGTKLAVGYVTATAEPGQFAVTSTFSQAISYVFQGDADLGNLVVHAPEPPKAPTPVTPRARGVVKQTAVVVLGDSIFVNFRGSKMTPRHTIKQTIRGCGGKIAARTTVKGFRGTKKWRIVLPYAKAPRITKVRTVIHEPGHRDKVVFSYFGPVPHASCTR